MFIILYFHFELDQWELKLAALRKWLSRRRSARDDDSSTSRKTAQRAPLFKKEKIRSSKLEQIIKVTFGSHVICSN